MSDFLFATLVRSTPLLITGLAVAIAFRAGIWNIGAEGQFLAGAARLGQGLGTQMVRLLVSELFADPRVTRVQVDPSPDNARAIRCYEKAGFRRVRQIVTPDGPALLMHCDP